ncbi:MAG: N-methylhydantoinase B [Oligoflexia bacterium]|nr:MAG: N-methylhydantoinase B [Oligoflexia bacterium]
MSSLQTNLFRIFLDETLSPFDSAACLTAEGEILDIKYETLADIGTLGQGAQTVMKYFPIQMGDVVILNDPYSGGSVLSTMTLITPLILGHNQVPDLYLAIRTGFRPQLVISKTLDEEGLRIPPTPLIQGRQINQAILDAMASHPLCPEGLKERLEIVLKKLWARIDAFNDLVTKHPGLCTKAAVKSYLKNSRQVLLDILSELPSGEAKTETKLESGEVIKLRIELSHEAVQFDFAGTTNSKRLCLTDASTFGACFGAVSAYLQKPLPLNSGTFSLFHVTSPLGCLLNAKYPSPTYKGMTEGTSVVASTVIQTLSEIFHTTKVSVYTPAPTQISLEFNSGKRFFDSLPGGVGASANADGADAIHLWVRNRLQNSVQEVETRFPLLIHHIGLRKGSGGKGQHKGGCGLMKEYEILEPAKLRWSIQHRKTPLKGMKGAQAGEAAEIFIKRQNKEKEQITLDEGEVQLNPGDHLIVASAGGGGWGKG